MTAEARGQMLAAIFDNITASAEGVNRLEPREDLRPYVVPAIPKPVSVLPAADRAEDGGQACGCGSSARSGRARMAPAGGLTLWSSRACWREAANTGHRV
jgi:hypothetical protein